MLTSQTETNVWFWFQRFRRWSRRMWCAAYRSCWRVIDLLWCCLLWESVVRTLGVPRPTCAGLMLVADLAQVVGSSCERITAVAALLGIEVDGMLEFAASEWLCRSRATSASRRRDSQPRGMRGKQGIRNNVWRRVTHDEWLCCRFRPTSVRNLV